MATRSKGLYDLEAVSQSYRRDRRKPGTASAHGILSRLKHNIREHGRANATRHILEVGCGAGAILDDVRLDIAIEEAQFVGLDLSYTQTAAATESFVQCPNMSFAVADAALLPLADRSFDVVYEYSALSWSVQPRAFIEEMLRVCRGLVLFRAVLAMAHSTFHACYFEIFLKSGTEYRPVNDLGELELTDLDNRLFLPTSQADIFKYPVWAQKVRAISRGDLDEVLNHPDFEVLSVLEEKEYDIVVHRAGDEGGPLRAGDRVEGLNHDIVEVVLKLPRQ